jgi:hypothetical protein
MVGHPPKRLRDRIPAFLRGRQRYVFDS